MKGIRALGTSRLSTSKRDENVDRVQTPVLEKRKITIGEVANILGIPFVRSAIQKLKD